MKYTLRIIILTLLAGLSTCLVAQNPKWYKKARKTQLNIISYDADGTMHQGQGFFINEKGTALAQYDLLKGATKATAVDCEGKQYDITFISGASSLYNTVKLETSNAKAATMPLAQQPAAENATIYVMPICNNDKNALSVTSTIAKVETFGDANDPYYTLSAPLDERYAGCPVYNEEGEVMGVVQMPAKGGEAPAYVLGASYGTSLKITALDANNNDMKDIGIAKDLPDDEQQAASYLYIMNRQDTEAYQRQIENFISKFPKNSTGYVLLAELQATTGKYKEAEETYAKALSMKTGHDDEIHHSFAKQLYQAGLKEQAPAEGWTMEHALQEAEAAYAVSPLAIYTSLEGMSLYAMKRYDEAYNKFMEVTKSNMRSAEYFLYASQCKQMAKASNEEVLALEDSAIACFTKPYPTEVASYLYLRSKTLGQMGRYKDAVTDLNEYEHLASGNVSAQFCYEREQMEMQCRMFPSALSDIEKAVKMQPNEPLFQAEKAVVNYRIGELDEAIAAAKEAIRLDAKFPDAYRILGICQRDKGNMTEAKKNLQQAIDRGDTLAQGILDKMQAGN